jgi:hypothetical protein
MSSGEQCNRIWFCPEKRRTNMSIHKPYLKSTIALTFAGALALPWIAFAGDLSEIKLPGDRA